MDDDLKLANSEVLKDFAATGGEQIGASSSRRFGGWKAKSHISRVPASTSSSTSSFVESKKRPAPRRDSTRKRKSDELSAVDLSQLMYEQASENPSGTEQQNSNGGLVLGMNSRWHNSFMQDLDRHDDQNDASSLWPSDGHMGSAKSLFDEIETNESDLANSTSSLASRTPILFRPPVCTKQQSSFEGDSPCAVDAFTGPCFSFWDRSLAWSEDDDEDEHGINEPHWRSGNVLEHLSVPKHLGKEHAPPQQVFTRPSRQPMSRLRTLESDSRHKLSSAKMFRQTDIDNVTEIHWEEKVLDTSELELMAKLSL